MIARRDTNGRPPHITDPLRPDRRDNGHTGSIPVVRGIIHNRRAWRIKLHLLRLVPVLR